ncbi:MAG: TetR/AcrR family transcriptional regulator [Bdellovibrio sp.]
MGIKGEKRRVEIIESATYCLLHFGDRKTTFDLIAEHGKVSKALVVRYLKNRENIFPVVLDFWISWARNKTELALGQAETSEQRLRNYIQVSIDLFRESEEFSRVYLLLHYFAGIDERFRVTNSEIKDVALKRISQILIDGRRLGEFNGDEPVEVVAKSIHNNLVGYVLSSITEMHKGFHLKLARVLEEECVSLAKKSGHPF